MSARFRPKRGPLVTLLAVDAALAVGGALLLRAGLADSAPLPAVAPAAPPAPKIGATSSPAPAPASAAAPSATLGAAPAASSEVPEPAATADPGTATVAAPAPETAIATPPAPTEKPDAPPPPTEGGAAPPPPPPPDDKPPKESDPRKKKPRKTQKDGPVDPYAQGALPELVERAFLESQGSFDACYQSAARGQPSVDRPQLTVSFKVLADGSVGGVKFVEDSTGLAGLPPCVQSIMARWSLRKGAAGEPQGFLRRIRFRT